MGSLLMASGRGKTALVHLATLSLGADQVIFYQRFRDAPCKGGGHWCDVECCMLSLMFFSMSAALQVLSTTVHFSASPGQAKTYCR